MSDQPNVMLMAVLTPDDLARRTARAICEELHTTGAGDFQLGGKWFTVTIMEDNYDDTYQIKAMEGQIVVHCYLTYGYGLYMAWAEVVMLVNELERVIVDLCEKFHCTHEIVIGANYG